MSAHNWERFERPTPRRRVFTDEQRVAAVDLAERNGKKAAAAELGISVHTLTDWTARVRRFAELEREKTMATATVTSLHPEIDSAGRDQRTEQWLDDLHVLWKFQPEMPLDQIDQQASLANQARLHALDDDVVDRYTADMARGDTFPALLALKRPRRKPMLLGGNHRYTSAIKAKRTTHAVYLVDAAPEMATRLMYEDNRRHGLPPSDEERIAQAIHLIDTGWTREAAAECIGIGISRVQSAMDCARADRRARTLGVAGFGSLPKTTRARLASVRSDPAFAEASKLVIAAGLSGDKLTTLIGQVNKCRSDADAAKVVAAQTEALRTEIQKHAGTGHRERVRTTPRVRMMNVIATLGACDPVDVAASCADKDQAASLARMILDTRKRLDATVAELQRRWKK